MKVQLAPDPPEPTPPDEGELATLDTWLTRLERTVEKGEYGPAEVGLKKWSESAAALLAAEHAALESAESALRARSDLRGLFEALEAKACQCGRSADPQLAALVSKSGGL